MAWKPIDDLSEAKRHDVMRRIVSGEAPSYVDEQGQRRVWISAGDPTPFWALDLVAKVRGEVSRLQRGLGQPTGAQQRLPERKRRAA